MSGGVGGNVPQGAMPCDVDTVVKKHCHNCHGASRAFGAPMSLVTLADFHRDYPVVTTPQLQGQSFKLYELARIRVNGEMGTTRMPQGPAMTPAESQMLSTWLTSGAPAGTACVPVGGAAGVGGVVGGAGAIGGSAGDVSLPSGGMGGGIGGAGAIGGGGQGGTDIPDGPPMIEDQCTQPGAFDPLTPKYPNEQCYDFLVHGNFGETDTSKFDVITGESYNQFYYSIPWEAGYVSTRFGQRFDNKEVLHHWLMFSQQFGMAPGTVEPNVLGTTLFTDAELIAGWAVGGCTTTYPEDVGVVVPTTGVIMIQWHHYNNTGALAQDGTAVQLCVVPEADRPNKAGLTFLGTETMTVPGGQTADASGTCFNDSSGPITIIGFTPHMHTIGINMKSEVARMGGTNEVVFDKPFQFDYQTNYMMNPPVILMPGESITSTCTYQNPNPGTVGFGQSTTSEMCYQFALSYPYGELNNGIGSLIGATNTCW